MSSQPVNLARMVSRALLVNRVSPEIFHFIALIHPIQWTIANSVGADRPAKRQKKTSCVSTGQLVPSTGALARILCF